MTYPLFLCATLYISGVVCAVKNIMDLQCLYWKGLYPVHALVSTKIFYRRVNIQKAFLQCGKAYESSRRWFWFNICHKFFNVCAIRALTRQMLSWVVFILKKNILGHISHAEGLSPVCSDHVFTIFKLLRHKKTFAQCLHLSAFSPKFVIMKRLNT